MINVERERERERERDRETERERERLNGCAGLYMVAEGSLFSSIQK